MEVGKLLAPEKLVFLYPLGESPRKENEMKPKDKLLKSLDQEARIIAQIREKVGAVPVNLIAEMFPQGRWYKNWGDIVFELPMSFSLIEEFEQAIAMQFPEFEKTRENQFVWDDQARAGRFIHYRKSVGKYDYVEFEVAFRSEVKGSTCILNPIGKAMKEVTTYEVVCSEAAASEF